MNPEITIYDTAEMPDNIIDHVFHTMLVDADTNGGLEYVGPKFRYREPDRLNVPDSVIFSLMYSGRPS